MKRNEEIMKKRQIGKIEDWKLTKWIKWYFDIIPETFRVLEMIPWQLKEIKCLEHGSGLTECGCYELYW